MRKFYLLLFAVMFAALPLSAQHNRYQQQDNPLLRNHLTTIENGWVRFIDDIDVPTFLQELASNKREMGLSKESKLRIRTGHDTEPIEMSNFRMGNLKKNVIRLDQYHNNIKVEAAQMVVNLDEHRNVRVIHGNLAEDLSKGGYSINIDEKTALRIALKAINAKKYAWESPEMEEQIKLDLDDRKATNYPTATLLYARAKAIKDFTNKNMHLVYRFEVSTIDPFDHLEVLIDTKSGEIIRNMSLMQEGGPKTGTVQTMYNGVQNFTTQKRSFPYWDYILKDKTRGTKIATRYYGQSAEISDQNNIWNGSDRVAATAHWAVQKAWDYYLDNFGQNGTDNHGGKINVSIKSDLIGSQFTKGAYNTDWLIFGFSSIGRTEAALDKVGHEFTHGVIVHESKIGGFGESGALNESFCDIFGVLVQHAIEGKVNWTFGEQTGVTTRSLKNPNDVCYPDQAFCSADTFEGSNWYSPTDFAFDRGGIHYNNGVQNHWFYLLSEGGSGENDNGDAFNVNGIGIAKLPELLIEV